MYVKIVLALTVFCAVLLIVKSETYDGRPPAMQGYNKYKRAKYNSSPQKYYSRPPVNNPNRGAYTPPPKYKADGNLKPPKVSKILTNEGVGGEDINDIVKQLSNQDLDSIIEFARGKDEDSEKYIEFNRPTNDDFKTLFTSLEEFNQNKYAPEPFRKDESNIIKELEEEIDSDSNYNIVYEDPKPFNTQLNIRPNEHSFNYVTRPIPPKSYPFHLVNYNENKNNLQTFRKYESNIIKNLEEETDSNSKYNIVYDDPKSFSTQDNVKPNKPSFNYATQPTYPFNSPNNVYDTSIIALKNEESTLQAQIAFLQSQIKDGVVYTDSKMMPEEDLPKPMNLRVEQDADASYSNNVPTYVKAIQSNSYKLENFGNLPLMEYNSKLDTVSSYHVPHYTVTSPSKKSSSSYSGPITPSYGSAPINVPPVETAPPPSAAEAQSDAHLKAVRIWSHKSKGTAYTLHGDGTLSLEKPNGNYGYH